MKSPNALLIAAVLGAAALAGCGQTGPLYMPTPPAKPAVQAPAPVTPAPATAPNPAPAPAPAQ